MQARSLEDCLNADAALARLTGHAGHLLKLQRIIGAALPTPLARACRIANCRAGVVFVHADNGAVAAKLRQLAPSLCAELRSSAGEITEIRVKVQARETTEDRGPGKVIAQLGSQTKQGLTNLSLSLPEDSPLRASLVRLLKTR